MTQRTREDSDRPRASDTTPPPADPSQPGVPGRDAPPRRDHEPHDALSNPVREPDPTEWPDPYDTRADPRYADAGEPPAPGETPHTPTGARSTSAPHASEDPEAVPAEEPKREKLDE